MARILARHPRIIAVASRDVRMVFNRDKGFFLTLDQNAETVKLALPEPSDTSAMDSAAPERAPADASPAEAAPTISVAKVEAVPSTPDTSELTVQPAASTAAATTAQPVMTTAEAIAAELATAEANRPPVSMSTFAPDNLVAGSGLLMKKRRPGAAMQGFRSIAADLFRS